MVQVPDTIARRSHFDDLLVIEGNMVTISSQITGLCSRASAKIPEIHQLERQVWAERQRVRRLESALLQSSQALTDADLEIGRLSTEVCHLCRRPRCSVKYTSKVDMTGDRLIDISSKSRVKTAECDTIKC